jgi:very-short-patch-repair endonuclease
MTERKAVHYGPVELIPKIICDGYVLDDGTAVLSERGTAVLLGVDHKHLNRMGTNWPPKTLKPFIDEGWSMGTNSVEVVAKNSSYQGRKISVYDSSAIENLIRAYVLALAYNKLRKNQKHIGERCAILQSALIRSALEVAIKEACGLPANIQATAQKHYTDIVKLMKESGLKCSVNDNIAIKTDITEFLDIPLSTLNSHLSKHRNEIKPIQLDRETIRAIGSTASRMNGYDVKDVGTIALGMDSVIGIDLKEKMFGSVSTLAKLDTKGEIEWQQALAEVFAGFTFYHNYTIGKKYRVDFYIKELNLILECNGYDNHANYNQAEEAKREKFLNKYRLVRFHHQIDWKTLVNGILRAKAGTVTRLDNVNFVYPQASKPTAILV